MYSFYQRLQNYCKYVKKIHKFILYQSFTEHLFYDDKIYLLIYFIIYLIIFIILYTSLHFFFFYIYYIVIYV